MDLHASIQDAIQEEAKIYENNDVLSEVENEDIEPLEKNSPILQSIRDNYSEEVRGNGKVSSMYHRSSQTNVLIDQLNELAEEEHRLNLQRESLRQELLTEQREDIRECQQRSRESLLINERISDLRTSVTSRFTESMVTKTTTYTLTATTTAVTTSVTTLSSGQVGFQGPYRGPEVNRGLQQSTPLPRLEILSNTPFISQQRFFMLSSQPRVNQRESAPLMPTKFNENIF